MVLHIQKYRYFGDGRDCDVYVSLTFVRYVSMRYEKNIFIVVYDNHISWTPLNTHTAVISTEYLLFIANHCFLSALSRIAV